MSAPRRAMSISAARKSLLNTFMRIVSLASGLVLLLVMARYLSPALVGLYGLFAATLSYCQLVAGVDFYTFAQRQLITAPNDRRSFILQHQTVAASAGYLFAIPLAISIFTFGYLPMRLALPFLCLLVTEHISLEAQRAWIALGHPLRASLLLSLRTVAWIVPTIIVFVLQPEMRSIEFVLAGWFGGSLVSALVGVTSLRIMVKGAWDWVMDWQWLSKGLRAGLLFFIATACFRSMLTLDRYAVEWLAGSEQLGAYVVFASMAMGLINLLEPAVYAFTLPNVVKAGNSGCISEYRQAVERMTSAAVAICLVLALIIAVAAPVLLAWIGKDAYLEDVHLLWMLLVAAVVYGIGLSPHYALYARRDDRHIVAAHVSALIIFIATIVVLGQLMETNAVAVALIAAFSWIAIYKYVRYRRLLQDMASKSMPVPVARTLRQDELLDRQATHESVNDK